MAQDTKWTATGKPYLSPYLVGGMIPLSSGDNMACVRDAAIRALGTESVAVTYRVYDGQCWYLAMPLHDLSSNPDSWCPLALALPGAAAYQDKKTIYWCEQNGHVAALLWNEDSARLQLISGEARLILPRLQTMERPLLQVTPEGYKSVEWQIPTLAQEEDLRLAVNRLILAGGLVILFSILVLYYANLGLRLHKPDLLQAQMKVQAHHDGLIGQAAMLAKSPTRHHLDNIQYLIEHVRQKNGILAKYEVTEDGRSAVWEVLLPQTVSDYSIGKFSGESLGVSEDWRVRIRGEI